MPVPPSPPNVEEFPSDEAIRDLLQERLRQKQAVGLIVGLVDQRGSRFVSAGTSGNPVRPVVDERTIFEIGSVSKVFTAAALADAVARGTVTLEDPLGKFLHLPEEGIGDRTLKELVTHTSGLPVQPAGLTWLWNVLRHPRDPYANYSQRDLEAYVKTLEGRKSRMRGRFRYSNLAVGILGNVLATRENTDYAGLITKRVTSPLGMSRTYLAIPPDELPFVAQPHTKSLRATPLWTLSAIPGAGGLRSCMRDMLLLASAALATTPPFFPFMFHPLAEASGPDRSVGFGWILRNSSSYRAAWHNGGTGGSRAFLGLEFRTGRAIVALANTSHSLDELGARLLLGPTLARDFF